MNDYKMSEAEAEIKRMFYHGWSVKDMAIKLKMKPRHVQYLIRKLRARGVEVKRMWKE